MESKALKRTQSIQRVHLRAAICISSPLFNGRGGQSRFIILPLPPSPSPSPSPIAGIDSPAAAAVAAAIRILLDSPLSAFRSFDLSFFLQRFNPRVFLLPSSSSSSSSSSSALRLLRLRYLPRLRTLLSLSHCQKRSPNREPRPPTAL